MNINTNMSAGIRIHNSVAISTRIAILIDMVSNIRVRIDTRINLRRHTTIAIQYRY